MERDQQSFSYLNTEDTPDRPRDLLCLLENLARIIQVTLDESNVFGKLEQFLSRSRLCVAGESEDLERCILFDEILDHSTTLFASGTGDENCGHWREFGRGKGIQI